jgi:predicted SpoU family rRNA methylase
MIRARLSNGSFIFGIDAENVRRLKEGKPIYVDLRPMGGSDVFMLMYGDTLEDIEKELAEASGRPLPPATPMPREH